MDLGLSIFTCCRAMQSTIGLTVTHVMIIWYLFPGYLGQLIVILSKLLQNLSATNSNFEQTFAKFKWNKTYAGTISLCT